MGRLGRWAALFVWGDLSDKGSEQRPERSEGGNHTDIWWQRVPGRRPESTKSLRLKVGESVAEAEQWERRSSRKRGQRGARIVGPCQPC